MSSAQNPDLIGATLDEAALAVLFSGAHTTNTFSDEKVDVDVVRRAYDDLRWAPTAMNSQPLRITVVESDEARRRLAPHIMEFNREKTVAAPLTLVVAYDLDWHREMGRLAPFREGFAEDAESKPAMRESMGRTNALIPVGYLLLALRAHGLQVGPMAGVDTDGIDAQFHDQKNWKALLVVNVGHAPHPADEDAQRPRQARLEFDEAAEVL